jgi:hypothetical protein
MFDFDMQFETTLIVVWAIAFAALLLNLLSCWLCCCCRSFDQPRRVLAGATAAVLVFAVVTTLYYVVDLEQLWPSNPRRALFIDVARSERLKRLKWQL